MKTADLITSYLSNEMNPEQERQFLLSVAASDSLRLALKSHVMLDKIVTNQIQHAHVPETVRSAIFTQMNASMAGAAPFGGAAAAAEADAVGGMSQLGRLFNGATGRFGRGALVALLTIGGYAAGYLTHSELAAPVAVSSPAAVTGKPVASNPAPAASAPATATSADAVQPANGTTAQSGTLAQATPKETPVRLRVAAADHQVSTRESFTRAHDPVSAKHPRLWPASR